MRFETGKYDVARTIGMADADGVSGIYIGVGGILKRDHGNADRDSRARNDNA
ncbi:MAG TPA: hypothetical protein VGH37_04535 [Candidatus Acidoferrum sp.]